MIDFLFFYFGNLFNHASYFRYCRCPSCPLNQQLSVLSLCFCLHKSVVGLLLLCVRKRIDITTPSAVPSLPLWCTVNHQDSKPAELRK